MIIMIHGQLFFRHHPYIHTYFQNVNWKEVIFYLFRLIRINLSQIKEHMCPAFDSKFGDLFYEFIHVHAEVTVFVLILQQKSVPFIKSLSCLFCKKTWSSKMPNDFHLIPSKVLLMHQLPVFTLNFFFVTYYERRSFQSYISWEYAF